MCLRFYFVGDEDLLEIIGNSKNIPRLQKHFKKMFAGVTAIILDETETVVTGIASREGEEVTFRIMMCLDGRFLCQRLLYLSPVVYVCRV